MKYDDGTEQNLNYKSIKVKAFFNYYGIVQLMMGIIFILILLGFHFFGHFLGGLRYLLVFPLIWVGAGIFLAPFYFMIIPILFNVVKFIGEGIVDILLSVLDFFLTLIGQLVLAGQKEK